MLRTLEWLHRICALHRRLLAGVALLLLVGGWLGFSCLPFTTDVAALLPDRGSRAAADFRLLAKAPLARRVVLRLRAGSDVEQAQLFKVADELAARLQPPLFTHVIRGPGSGGEDLLLSFALTQWANLFDENDYDFIRSRLAPEKIEADLCKAYLNLLQPTGFLQKGMILADPLEFRSLLFPRLASLNPLGKARVVDGHFLSEDGRETMLLLETPIGITDFKGSKRLLQELDTAIKEVVPAGIVVVPLCGHAYTVANATTIQRDMVVVISASLVALLLVFLIFMRRRRALLVFLLPVAILGPALALTGLVEGSISAITVGFGAVLLGVTIDYGLHLYFALQNRARQPGLIVAALAVPLLGAGLTTIGAFSAQLFSALPGQRQLALFAIFGVFLALILSLLVLPHFFRGAESAPELSQKLSEKVPLGYHGRSAWIIVVVWALFLGFLAWSAVGVRCVGDLREVNLVPQSLRAAENDLKSVWGEVRGRALIFAQGRNFEEALQVNDRLYSFLRREFAVAGIVSLAPVMPSQSLQKENRQKWQTFWTTERLSKLRYDLSLASRNTGFSETAFAPFLTTLTSEPPFLTESFWLQAGFSSLFDATIEKDAAGVTILTLVPDGSKLVSLFSRSDRIPDGVHLVSPQAFSRVVSAAIARDLRQFILLALVVVTLILSVLLRNFYQVLLALLPVLAGLLSMFGIMGFLGLSFNLFNLVAAILIIGLGVDYGIFMVYRLFRGSDAATEKAVLVSGLTTLAGFGVLVLARHPALNSIGLTVLLGVGGALPTVLWVLPALAGLINSARPKTANFPDCGVRPKF
ncbi:MAG: efflux RND transporter permease subunit [Pseudomonadota bacterium]|nr:efflux RND transporter permease subunit [Pseudomonadota bacterium]